MATVEELVIQIKADTKGLTTELNGIKSKLDKSFDNKPVNKFGSSIKGLLGPIAAVGTAMLGITAIKGIAKVGDEFESLGITLSRIYGGAQAGTDAFADIRSFAETTPFQLEDVTKAFIQLKSNGIEPTEEMLTIFGDAASAALNPLEAFNAMVRITQRSAAGGLGLEELEQIANQGIPVYTILKDRLEVARTEISELGKTAEGAALIMDVLKDGLEKDFGGLMGQRMELLDTKVSNAEIGFKALADALYQSGINTFLKSMADNLGEVANASATAVKAMNANISTELQLVIQDKGASRTDIFSQALEDADAISEKIKLFETALAVSPTNQDFIRQLASAKADLDSTIQALTTRGFDDTEVRAAFAHREIENLGEALLNLDEGGDDRVIAALNSRRNALAELVAAVDNASKQVSNIPAESGEGKPTTADPEDQARIDNARRLLKVQEAAASVKKMFEDTITPAEELSQAFATLDFLSANLASTSEVTAEQISAVRTMLGGMQADFTTEELEENFGSLKSAIDSTITPLEALQDELKALEAVQHSGDQEAIRFVFGTVDSTEVEEALGRIRAEIKGIADDTATEVLSDQFGSLKTVIDGTVTPLEALTSQFEKLKNIVDSGDEVAISFLFGTNDLEAVKEVMGRITGQMRELEEQGKETAATFAETMAPAIAQLSHTFTNDFVNSLLSGRDALESFKNFAKNIVSQIIATFLQMAVVNQILNAVFSSIPGFQAQPTMSFGGGGGAGSGRSFAGGGALQGRTPYLVGERGPELFVPNTSGTIKTNADTKNKMGGDTFIVNQSLNFSTGVVPTVRAEIQKMLPQISDVTKNAVLESTRRGGTYRRGLLGA
jgi:hypothetical protein